MVTTFKTVENATFMANETARANNLKISKNELHSRVFNWYCHSDITDIFILAGCALCSDYFPGATYDNMRAFGDYWFPVDPEEDTHISALEAAMHDEVWQ